MRLMQRSIIGYGLTAVVFALMGRVGAVQKSIQEQRRVQPELHAYFEDVTDQLAGSVLSDVTTLEQWQQRRPELRSRLLEMLGLDPLPDRTDLQATVTGTLEHDDFVVEKIHFQSRPGLYVTANFYRPKQVSQPLPTILYVCGHGNVKIDGVSYGSKANYQHHPAWFVREGYCCLVLDTLQLGEIEGLHHGTYREGMWWWLTRGYTPAGVEAWNCVRALDYLETRPEVDMKRIGVTGRSGGGVYSWWLAAIDDRPACLVPVAGITDLENYIVDGCIEGHCDCMFMVNTYRWDFEVVAALVAPRPLLFSNTDKDTIFPLDGVVRTHERIQKIYDLHDAADKLGLLITEGPHKDTQDLQVPAFRWMNRWLKGKDEPVTRIADKPLDPKQLKVFSELPQDERNTTIHESFVPAASVEPPPESRGAWDSTRDKWLALLQEKSFRGWPKQTPEPASSVVATKEAGGLRLRIHEFISENNVRLPIYELAATKWPKYSATHVTVLDDAGWDQLRADLAPDFSDLLGSNESIGAERSGKKPGDVLKNNDWTNIYVLPRGVGPTAWNGDAKKKVQIQRRYALVGQTWHAMQIWDVCRAVDVIRSFDRLQDAEIRISGEGVQAGIALYAGILSPHVSEMHLYRPTTSHREGPYLLNVLRFLDLPQAVALAFPRRVVIHDSQPSDWQWPAAVANLYASDRPPLVLEPAANE